jgi:hypothetical protein
MARARRRTPPLGEHRGRRRLLRDREHERVLTNDARGDHGAITPHEGDLRHAVSGEPVELADARAAIGLAILKYP